MSTGRGLKEIESRSLNPIHYSPGPAKATASLSSLRTGVAKAVLFFPIKEFAEKTRPQSVSKTVGNGCFRASWHHGKSILPRHIRGDSNCQQTKFPINWSPYSQIGKIWQRFNSIFVRPFGNQIRGSNPV